MSFRVVCISSCILFTDSNEADDLCLASVGLLQGSTAGAGYVIEYS